MRKALIFSLIIFLIGCAETVSTKPVLIRQVLPVSPSLQIEEREIQRSELQAALQGGDVLNAVRLVQLFDSQQGGPVPQYRIFEIKPKSIYELLGLENSDVIVAAHGYVIPDWRNFPPYIGWLVTQNSSEIELKRQGRAMVMKYRIVPGLSVGKEK